MSLRRLPGRAATAGCDQATWRFKSSLGQDVYIRCVPDRREEHTVTQELRDEEHVDSKVRTAGEADSGADIVRVPQRSEEHEHTYRTAPTGTIPTPILEHCETIDYGLLQSRKAFSLLSRSAGYNKNATISGSDDPGRRIGTVEGAQLRPFSQLSRARESRDYPTSRSYSSWVPIQTQT